MTRRRTARFSFFASFAVYLTPVVGPHFVSLWGVTLWHEVTRGERSLGWLAADLFLALCLQAVAAFVLYGVIRRGGGWRFAWLLVTLPALFVALESIYLIAIPAAFLIDRESSPERREWNVECILSDTRIVPVHSGAALSLERNGVAWVAHGPELSRTGLLSMPGCTIRDIPLDSPHAGGGLRWVTPDGAALFTRWDRATAEQSHWYLSRDGQERELEPPTTLRYWSPALSTDGRMLAWVAPRTGLILQAIAGDGRVIPLPETVSRSLELVSFENDPCRLTLATGSGEVLAVNGEGRVIWGPRRLDGLEHPSRNFRWLGEGWVAWDGYREDGPYRILWSLPEGEGRYEIPRGRSITSVAVHPSGNLIGVSVSPAYNVGSVRDSVFVVRVKDGHEVYRRYLASYARSEIAFLGESHFAMSLHEEGRAMVEILHVAFRH